MHIDGGKTVAVVVSTTITTSVVINDTIVVIMITTTIATVVIVIFTIAIVIIIGDIDARGGSGSIATVLLGLGRLRSRGSLSLGLLSGNLFVIPRRTL